VITFRPLRESDFELLTRWLAAPHVRRFFQKMPATPGEVAAKYGPRVRAEVPALSHLALSDGAPFGYLQCYRNADWPDWAANIQVDDGISIDLFIGEPGFLHRGLGRAMLADYLRDVAFPAFPAEGRAYIAHEPANTAAVACSRAVGFKPLRGFVEDATAMTLFALEREVRTPAPP
jgi:aminoglycoside 6'-N-acetyltransferase